MRSIPIGIKIDGITILVGVGLIGAAYVYFKFGAIKKALNPADPDNIINRAAESVIGEENISTGADYVFGAFDLLNPFASEERKRYARQVFNPNEVE